MHWIAITFLVCLIVGVVFGMPMLTERELRRMRTIHRYRMLLLRLRHLERLNGIK